MIDRPAAYRKQYEKWSTHDKKRYWIQLHHIPLAEWQEIRAALQPLMTPASEKWAELFRPAQSGAGTRANSARRGVGSLASGGGKRES